MATTIEEKAQPARQEAKDVTERRGIDIPGLTGIRAFGALMIGLYHFQDLLYEGFPFLRCFSSLIGQGGYIGVTTFFILSGYLMYHHYCSYRLLHIKGYLHYLWLRIARLLPMLIITQVIAIPIVCISVQHYGYWGAPIPEWYSVGGWLKNTFLLQSVNMPWMVYSWNQPAWCVSAEFVACVFFPVAVALALLLDNIKICRNKILNLIAACGFVYMGQNVIRTDAAYGWLLQVLFAFGGGMLLRRASSPGTRGSVCAVLQVLCPIAIIACCYFNFLQPVGICLLLFVFSLTVNNGIVNKVLSSRLMRFFGKLSYSFYLLHWCVFACGTFVLLELPVIRAEYLRVFILIVWAVLFVLTWLASRFIEEPCAKKLRSVSPGIERVMSEFARGWRDSKR